MNNNNKETKRKVFRSIREVEREYFPRIGDERDEFGMITENGFNPLAKYVKRVRPEA